MALRAGYYGIKNALLKKLQGLSDALVIKSIGEGLDLSAAGELSNTSTGGVDYSTTEQDTGIKWVNGKNVFQKTLEIADETILINPNTWTDVGTDTSIDELINSIILGGGNHQVAGYMGLNKTSEGKLQVLSTRTSAAYVGNITYFYTKTSAANSTRKSKGR